MFISVKNSFKFNTLHCAILQIYPTVNECSTFIDLYLQTPALVKNNDSDAAPTSNDSMKLVRVIYQVIDWPPSFTYYVIPGADITMLPATLNRTRERSPSLPVSTLQAVRSKQAARIYTLHSIMAQTAGWRPFHPH